MQFKITTDYAIRVLIVLMTYPGYMTMSDLAVAVGAKPAYLVKVIKQLRDRGWVDSRSSETGGYRFIGNANQITLLDVMKVTEETVRINRCLEDDCFCSRNATENCPVHEVYVAFQKKAEQYFGSITIHNLFDLENMKQL